MPVGDLRRTARKLDRLVDEMAKQEDAAGTRPRRGTDTAKSGWRWAIDARVAKRASRLHAAIDKAGAVYLPERLHDVRLAIKKMRYAVELGADASGARREADLRALTRGQEILCRMLDLQMLIDRVRDMQAALTPPSLGAWRDLDAVVGSLDDDCRRLHARYMRARVALLAIADRYVRGPVAEKIATSLRVS